MATHDSARAHRSRSLQTPGDRPRQVRPPSGGIRLPFPGVSENDDIRQTATSREFVRPIKSHTDTTGFSMAHAYVRRFWVAAIGPGAVADLLRLAAAAQSGRSLRRPLHLSALLREGLVSHAGGILFVPETVPIVPPRLVSRMPPALRRTHMRHAALMPKV